MNSLDSASSLTAGARAALAEYLEELARRIERGEKVTFESEVAAHTDFAEPLRELWPALQLLVSLGKTASTVSTELNPLADIGPSLGEFRILSELGRGGMGVVYEAEQGPLGRRVALKVLPFAAVLDQRQLARFQNEARAAASLHHTNIVPVFSVGCDRGRHYYAMQLIRGRSLEELLRERRDLSSQPPRRDEHAPQAEMETVNALLDDTLRPQERFARIAQLGIQAAEALHCAHEHGVIHRDVKPSNLLIDTSGKLWVADFGLARFGGDVGVTLTGDVLGTLRYMSPEQAAGMPAAVDHRTDIYSLGATLYELATERPVVQGQDRAAMLREIAETDPAPPRKHTPAMPADLETILLKCLAKEPFARYDTAQALADDLRRFLEQKPVMARRPSVWDRADKWMRRRRTALMSIGATLLVAITATAALQWRANRAALRNAARANANLDLARDTIDAIFIDDLGNDIAEAGPLTQREQKMLDKALDFYQEAAQQNDQDPQRLPAAVRVSTNIARALYDARKYERSQQTAEQALRMFDSLKPEDQLDPQVNESRFKCLGILLGTYVMQRRDADASALAMMTERLMKDPNTEFDKLPNAREIEVRHHFQIGLMHYIQLQHEDALVAYRAALDGARAMAAVKPDNAAIHIQIGDIMHSMGHASLCLGYVSAGQKWFESAISELLNARRLDPTEPEVLRLLEWVRMDRATLLRERGREHDALRALREAAETVEELSSDSSVTFEHCQNRAKLLTFLIRLEASLGDEEHVAETCARIDRTLIRLARSFPGEPAARSSAAITRYDVGTSLLLGDKYEAAVGELLEADAALASLLNDSPHSEDYRQHLAMTRYNLASAYLHTGDRPSAERFWIASQKEWEKLAEQYPENSEYRSRVAACLNSLAMHAREDHQHPLEAIALSTEAIRHQKVARGFPSPYEKCDEFLIQHYENLVRSLLAMGDHERVDAVMVDYFADMCLPVQQSACAASYYCQCADLAIVDDRYDSELRASLTNRYLQKATAALEQVGAAAILSPSSWGLLAERKQDIASRLRRHAAAISSSSE